MCFLKSAGYVFNRVWKEEKCYKTGKEVTLSHTAMKNDTCSFLWPRKGAVEIDNPLIKSQSEFRKGRSIKSHICTIRQTMKSCNDKEKECL